MEQRAFLIGLLAVIYLERIFASPVDDGYASALQAAECGQTVEISIGLQDTVTFSSAYLTELNDGNLPVDCTIDWRIALLPVEGIENWGISVQGTIDLIDDANTGDKSCSSSSVKVTDEDAEGDLASVSKITCGSRSIDFKTYEDSVNVILKTGSSATSGQGFVLSFKPIYGCGGMLKGESGDQFVISTPEYPKPYTKDLFCLWDLTVPEDSQVTLSCDKFMIMRRRGGDCNEDLLVSSGGTFTDYCGKELQGSNNAQVYTGARHMDFRFRSFSRVFGWPGFYCTLSIE